MKFEWDQKKAEQNYKKHKVSFESAERVFNDPLALTIPDESHSTDEERWITLGQAGFSITLIVVVHTYRDKNDEEIIRIISARKATKKEKKNYTK